MSSRFKDHKRPDHNPEKWAKLIDAELECDSVECGERPMNPVNKKVVEFNKAQLEQKELNDFIDELKCSNSILCKRAATSIRAKDNRILKLESMLEKKLDLIKCGIAHNYGGDPYENKLYTEARELLLAV